MAIYTYVPGETPTPNQPPTTTTADDEKIIKSPSTLYTIIAAATILLPLIAISSLTLLFSFGLLLVSSPLLFLFSPLFLLAGSVLLASLSGFGFAGAAGFAGLWSFKKVAGMTRFGQAGGKGKTGRLVREDEGVTESRQRVMEMVSELEAGGFQREVRVYPPDDEEDDGTVNI